MTNRFPTSALADHPGFTFSAAGDGYRLYRDGVFLVFCPRWGDVIAEARYAEAAPK